MKALLLRVGIDKGSGGALAPIFEDGSFEYIPIPEFYSDTTENRTFSNSPLRYNKFMVDYVPAKISKSKLHFDPEFETYTYGDVSRSKTNYLLKLEKKDLLIFYAGLTPYKNQKFHEALYIIGYFVVQDVIDFNRLNPEEIRELVVKYSNNAHIKSKNMENLALVVGNDQSRLLEKAILISERRPDRRGRHYHAVSKKMEKLLGIKGSIQRSVPPRMIVNKPYIDNLKKLIDIPF